MNHLPNMHDAGFDPDMIRTGTVKWFDPARGFGFILCEELPRDVLLHLNVLRNFGQSSVADGSTVTFRCHSTPRGYQVTEVLSVEPPAQIDDQPEDLPPLRDDLPYLPARVKWFDKAKGFGFANAFGTSDDIFVHIDVLRRFGLADLAAGEAICLRAVEGARGRQAVEVRRWEYCVE